MKVIVIGGGTGLIGWKTVAILRQRGHEVVAVSPRSGVKVTGEGLKEAVAGAQVVIDLANSPSFEDKAEPTPRRTSAFIESCLSFLAGQGTTKAQAVTLGHFGPVARRTVAEIPQSTPF